MNQNMPYSNQRKTNFGIWIFLIFVVFGAYFFNLVFNFLAIPTTFSSNLKYIQALNFITGLLLVIGGFKFLLSKKNYY